MKNIFCVFTIITLLEYSLAVPTNTTTAFVKTTTTKAPAPPPSSYRIHYIQFRFL